MFIKITSHITISNVYVCIKLTLIRGRLRGVGLVPNIPPVYAWFICLFKLTNVWILLTNFKYIFSIYLSIPEKYNIVIIRICPFLDPPPPINFVHDKISIYLALFRVRLRHLLGRTLRPRVRIVKTLFGPSAAARTG